MRRNPVASTMVAEAGEDPGNSQHASPKSAPWGGLHSEQPLPLLRHPKKSLVTQDARAPAPCRVVFLSVKGLFLNVDIFSNKSVEVLVLTKTLNSLRAPSGVTKINRSPTPPPKKTLALPHWLPTSSILLLSKFMCG